MVQLHRAAHHAGRIKNPTVPMVKRLMGNPNHYSIGIECVDNGEPYTADRKKQLPQVAKLVARLAKEYDIPLDRNHVVGHRQIFSAKGCPGNVELDILVEMALNENDQNQGISVDDKKLADKLKQLMERYQKGTPEDFDTFLLQHIGEDGQGGFLGSSREFEKKLKQKLQLPEKADKNTVLIKAETLVKGSKNEPERPVKEDWPLPKPEDVRINGLEITVHQDGKVTKKVNYEVK